MEHRWGTRQMLDIGVKLYAGSKRPIFGRMLNTSASGAYVATSTMLPIMTHVHVALGWRRGEHDRHHRIAAYVVRVDGRGVGIEWQEFASLPTPELIDDLDLLPTRACEYVPLRRPNSIRGAAQNGV